MATSSPLVTCVLIFLDGERFIDEAIGSVVGQAGFDDWELILVDDGSTDASSEIARRWAATDPARIRYIDHPGHANLGMSAARNAGVAVARGTYIGFLDCDDVWLPSAMAHCRRVLASNPTADVLMGGTWRWWSWTRAAADAALDHEMPLPQLHWRTTIEPPALFEAIYGIGMPGMWYTPAICSLLIRREALLRVGGFDAAFRGLFEDQVLYTKIALNLRTVIDPRPLALYRQHPDSACEVSIAAGEWQRTGPSRPMNLFLRWMQEYVAQRSAPESTAMAIVERHVRPDASKDARQTTPASRYRKRVPRSLRTIARRVLQARRRLTRSSRRSIIARWSEQHLGAAAASMSGDVLAVVARRRAGQPWERDVPHHAFPAGARVHSSSWRASVRSGSRFDHVVVPYAVGRHLALGLLLDGARHLVRPSGTITLLLPRIRIDQLTALVAARMPGWSLHVETFGNDVTAIAVDRGTPPQLLGATVDHHDGTHNVMLAATLSAPPTDPEGPSER